MISSDAETSTETQIIRIKSTTPRQRLLSSCTSAVPLIRAPYIIVIKKAYSLPSLRLLVLSQIYVLYSRYVSWSLFPSIHSLSISVAVNFKNCMLLSSRVFVCNLFIPFFMGQKQGKGVLMYKKSSMVFHTARTVILCFCGPNI